MENTRQNYYHPSTTLHDPLVQQLFQPASSPFKKKSSSVGTRQVVEVSAAHRKSVAGPYRSARKHSRSSTQQHHPYSRGSPERASKYVSFRKHHLATPEENGKVSVLTSEGSPPATSTRGLRQMSVKICETVKACGKTTCNAVADELLQIIKQEQTDHRDGKACDDKNIRRRLYDALNVLEAVEVIEKENKDITWKGAPEIHYIELERLVGEHDKRRRKIEKKNDELREKLSQQISYRNLVRLNKRRAHLVRSAKKIPLPFVILNAHPYAEIHCDASSDLTQMMIDVNAPFALHDDNSILRQMGLDQTTMADLQDLIPSDMLEYSMKQGLLHGILHVTPTSKKRSYSTARMAAASISLPKEGWTQPRPAKRFKAALKKRGR